MKLLRLWIILLLLGISCNAQNVIPKFGSVSMEEMNMPSYPNDTTANALVLFEQCDVKFVPQNNRIHLETTIYKKIKIFNKEGVDYGNVSVKIYDDQKGGMEIVQKIKGITHSPGEPDHYLSPKNIFQNKIDDHWHEVVFTLPNIKEGSVLEYSYIIESEFFFNLRGWYFQSEIPKLYSEYHALIPAFWNYNGTYTGYYPLSLRDAKLKKNCFDPGNGVDQPCDERTYVMKDIPSFIEDDVYSTSPKNYIAHIEFELAEAFKLDGTSTKYTTTWSDADRKLKSLFDLNKSSLEGYFRKNIPDSLFSNPDPLIKAKSIYHFVQNHYTLDPSKDYIFDDRSLKDMYDSNLGGVPDINLTLLHAMNAAGFDAKIFLSATRSFGRPTKIHPVITDFNYLSVFVNINDRPYFLDASQKLLPFGFLPFECLNQYGRVIDIEDGSFWADIIPNRINATRRTLKLTVNEDGTLEGSANETFTGYEAFIEREKLSNNNLTKSISGHKFEPTNFIVKDFQDLEKPIEENYILRSNSAEIVGNSLYINPFLFSLEENPLKLNRRNYPVDFGYQKTDIYAVEIEFPESFSVTSLPVPINMSIPKNGGSFTSTISHHGNKITLYYKINLLKSIYEVSEYAYLKEFFSQIINFQNSFIILDKTISN
ncbi:hypothetical protein [Namhaeicola litoreus]|uniref:DUF3857 domain-containing protein n=1 Tax=Namhaeicola litoreus TaxID=1052145 RepID=A0ABW3Y2E0_9FLAO